MHSATMNGPINYRNDGDWGPAYLLRLDSADIGVVRLRPGDLIDNHYHRHCDESFIVIEGQCTLWIDASQRRTLHAGDIASCSPGERHCLINESDMDCRFVFLKTPPSADDTIAEPWLPPHRTG